MEALLEQLGGAANVNAHMSGMVSGMMNNPNRRTGFAHCGKLTGAEAGLFQCAMGTTISIN